MGGKRKKTADRKTPPSKGQPGRKSVEAPAPAASSAMGGKRKETEDSPPLMSGKRKKTADSKTPPSKGQPSCKLVAVPSPVAVEAPVASSSMVPHDQPEGEPGTLESFRSAIKVSAAKERVVKLDFDLPMTVLKCDVCHGLLKAPIFQCSLMRHVACSSCNELHGGKCRPCADLAASVVYVQNSYLDTLFGHIKAACPFKKYGCTSSDAVGYLAMAHAVTCAFVPRPCPKCSFKGPIADLVRHVAESGRHFRTTHKITYGQDYMYGVGEMESSLSGGFDLLVAEDGGVFLLFVDLREDFVTVLCVTNGACAPAWPVYSYWVAVDAPPAESERCKLKPEIKKVANCSDWKLGRNCFRVLPGMLREEQTSKSIRLRFCILKHEGRSVSC